jgi:hypothetical protein
MKRNPQDEYFAAYSWSKMNNEQRRQVVKLFEAEYGPDFMHKAKFSNEYNKPVVGAGKLLSKKKDLSKDSLGFYPDNILDTMVRIRSLVPIDIRLPVVRKSKPSEKPTFGVYLIVTNGAKTASMVESIHSTKEDAERQMAEMNEVLSFRSLDAKREVRLMDNASSKRTYDVMVWDYDKREYVPHREFPIHESKASAIDRASHDTRFMAAFFIQWDTWNAAGCKAPEKYDYFEKENVLRFGKDALLKGHANPRCSDCWHLCETPYWKKLTDPNVDEAFLDFCDKL